MMLFSSTDKNKMYFFCTVMTNEVLHDTFACYLHENSQCLLSVFYFIIFPLMLNNNNILTLFFSKTSILKVDVIHFCFSVLSSPPIVLAPIYQSFAAYTTFISISIFIF